MSEPVSEPSPRRAVVIQGLLYLLGLFIVAIVTTRAASYDTQIANLRNQVTDINVQLQQLNDDAVVQHRIMQADIAALEARVAALEAINSTESPRKVTP
jgi:mRNA-degrading endonuclease toxin of MazEF toxin-antitoxin module